MVDKVILAPVPLVHLEAAEKMAEASAAALFAFGSNVELDASFCGREIYFYGSETGYSGLSKDLRKIPFRGVLVRNLPSSNGKYVGQALRPFTAENDTAFIWFFEVSGLARLEKSLHVSDFRSAANKKLSPTYFPRRPAVAVLSSK